MNTVSRGAMIANGAQILGTVVAVLLAPPPLLFLLAAFSFLFCFVLLELRRRRTISGRQRTLAILCSLLVCVGLAFSGFMKQSAAANDGRRAACEQVQVVLLSNGEALNSIRERMPIPRFEGEAWRHSLDELSRLRQVSIGVDPGFSAAVNELVMDWTALDGNTFPSSSGKTYWMDGFKALARASDYCVDWGFQRGGRVTAAGDAEICQSVQLFYGYAKAGLSGPPANRIQFEDYLLDIVIKSTGEGQPNAIQAAAFDFADQFLKSYISGQFAPMENARAAYSRLISPCATKGVVLTSL